MGRKQYGLVNLTLLLALVIQAMVANISLPSLVLCIGNDGHLQIELKLMNHECSTICEPAGESFEAFQEPIHLHHNEDCKDIALFQDLYEAIPNELKMRSGLAIPLFPCSILMVSDADQNTFSVMNFINPEIYPRLSLLKTTVLRC